VLGAFATAISRVHDEPGVELYALHQGRDRLVMIEQYESKQPRSEHLKARPSPTCGLPVSELSGAR
jgi:quinol monooxygenase YgiN